jgi:ribosome maturation factor RimP
MNGSSRHSSRQPAQGRSAQGRSAQGRSAQGQGQAAQGRQARPGSRTESRPRPAPPVPLPDSDRLIRLLEPVVHAMDMDLESIKVTAAGRRRILRVIVDADGGVSLDDIALASRELSLRLDNGTEMGELPYTLEVSSPGVDRPLTQPRHWRRATGRLVEVPVAAGDSDKPAMTQGRIVATSESGITLEQDGVSRDYAYTDLGPGKIQIEFGHVSPAGDEDRDDEDLDDEDLDDEDLDDDDDDLGEED